MKAARLKQAGVAKISAKISASERVAAGQSGLLDPGGRRQRARAPTYAP